MATNPATAAMAGYKIVSIRSDASGDMDIEHLKQVVSDRTAGLMLTNPNTLGLFSPKISEITAIVHKHGGLLYYDGANLNAILNIVRPGDMGFDVMHINLHKTFSTPHGGGGPGSGPVLCNSKLKDFLPVPRVEKAALIGVPRMDSSSREWPDVAIRDEGIALAIAEERSAADGRSQADESVCETSIKAEK